MVEQGEAFRAVHQPRRPRPRPQQGLDRLRFDEAFALQLTMARRRADAAAHGATPRPRRAGGLLEAFDARLPFVLTAGQVEIGDLLFDELARHDADAAAAAGRGRLRQDPGGPAGDARGRRRRRPGRAARPDRGPRHAAPAHDHADARRPGRGRHARGRRARDRRRPADRLAGCGPAARGARRGRLGHGRAGRRHARAAQRGRRLRRPGAGRGRRAAPLRRRAAGRARGQGERPAARPGDDRHAHPALGGHDRLRRPRDVDAARAAGRAGRREHRGGGRPPPADLGGPGLGPGARGGRGGPAGVRGLRADLVDEGRDKAKDRRREHRRRRRRLRPRGRAAGGGGRGPVRRAVGRRAVRGRASRCCTASCRPRRRTR